MMKTFEEKDRTLTALQDEMTDLKMKSIELRGKLTNAQSEVDKTVSSSLQNRKKLSMQTKRQAIKLSK